MKEYIEREAALDRIRDYIEEYSWWTDEHGWHSDKWCAMKEAEMVLEKLPAADVREVVLCKDCKNRFNYDICACRGDDWFCGYGEKREEA